MAETRICSVPDCGRPHVGRGLCQRHYHRWRAHGSTSALYRAEPLREPARIDVVIERAEKTALVALAAQRQRTVSILIHEAIQQYLERTEGKHP